MEKTLGASDAVLRLHLNGREQNQVGRSTLSQSSATTRSVVVGAPPTLAQFESDEERYEWEVERRYDSMDTLDRWNASDGVYTIGPPIPPGATVFFDEKATPAFKKATLAGYLACRPAAVELCVSRKTIRLLVDRIQELKVAYVVYPGKVRNSRYHCRVIHKNSLRLIKKNVRLWTKKATKGGKKTNAKNIRRSSGA